MDRAEEPIQEDSCHYMNYRPRENRRRWTELMTFPATFQFYRTRGRRRGEYVQWPPPGRTSWKRRMIYRTDMCLCKAFLADKKGAGDSGLGISPALGMR